MKFKTEFRVLKLKDIVPPPYNPREDIVKGSDEYEALRRSLEQHGMVEPPVVNIHNMRCIGGNQRITVLRDMGVEEVLCSIIDQPDEEKEKMCDIVCEAGADYIKTSTGFSTAGANFHDVELMVKGVHGRCKVKAAGGISTVEDMETFLALGADRLGTSRAVKILNGEQAKGY